MLAIRSAAVSLLLAACPLLEAAQDPPPAEAPPATGKLHFEVVDEEGEGLFQVGIYLEPSQAERDAAQGGLLQSTQTRTDPDGFASLSIPAGERRTVTVGRFGAQRLESLDIEPLEAGEERELRVEMQTQADLEVTRRVVLAETGEPVVGAAITVINKSGMTLGSAGKMVMRREPGGGFFGPVVTRTDEEGRFRLKVRSWQTATVFAFEDGLTLQGCVIHDPSHEIPEADLVMRQSGSLGGNLVGELSDDLIVVAQINGYSLPMQGNEHDPWTGVRLQDVEYRAAVADDGSFVFENMPSGVPFQISVMRGKTLVSREANLRSLRPGEAKTETIELARGATIRGILRDEEGKPVPGHRMGVQVGAQSRKVFQSYEEFLREGVTAEDGSFEFPDLQPGSYEVGARVNSRGVLIALTVGVELAGEDVEADVLLQQGRFIEGRILSMEGDPIALHVLGHSPGTWAYAQQTSGADGTFRLGPLPPGPVQLSASGGGLHWRHDPLQAPWTPLEVEEGATGVELRLQPGGSISGKAVDAETREPVAASYQFSRLGKGWRTLGGTAAVDFTYGGLIPGRYSIVGTAADGRIGWRIYEVEAGVSQIDQELRLGPGGSIEVTHSGAFDHLQVECLQDDFVYDFYTVTKGETYTFHVPVGEVQVRLYKTGGADAPPAFEEIRSLEIAQGQTAKVLFEGGEER